MFQMTVQELEIDEYFLPAYLFHNEVCVSGNWN